MKLIVIYSGWLHLQMSSDPNVYNLDLWIEHIFHSSLKLTSMPVKWIQSNKCRTNKELTRETTKAGVTAPHTWQGETCGSSITIHCEMGFWTLYLWTKNVLPKLPSVTEWNCISACLDLDRNRLYITGMHRLQHQSRLTFQLICSLSFKPNDLFIYLL